MAGGNSNETSSNNLDIENDDKDMESNFADARKVSKSINPNSKSGTSTGSEKDLAKEEEIGLKYHFNTIKAEQRVRFLGNLAYLGVGTNRVELNQLKSRKELRRDSGRRVGEIVAEMERKEVDAKREASFQRQKRNRWNAYTC